MLRASLPKSFKLKLCSYTIGDTGQPVGAARAFDEVHARDEREVGRELPRVRHLRIERETSLLTTYWSEFNHRDD